MMQWVFLAAVLQQDPNYPDLSRKQGLGVADQLMRDGKYLEAAVAYRNVLLMPGDREAVRIPLALALLAKGDAVYAGIEVRRAHMLYPEFARLAIDPAELFGSKEPLAKAADAASGREKDGDGAEVSAAAAYAYYLVGDRERAQASLAKYVQTRGNDAFVRDLTAAVTKLPAPKPPVIPVAAAPLPPPTSPSSLRGGDPVRAGARFIELHARPRGEILAR